MKGYHHDKTIIYFIPRRVIITKKKGCMIWILKVMKMNKKCVLKYCIILWLELDIHLVFIKMLAETAN